MLLPHRHIRHLILPFAHVIEMQNGPRSLYWQRPFAGLGLAPVSSALQVSGPSSGPQQERSCFDILHIRAEKHTYIKEGCP